MIVLGLTGGIGTGKSTVATELKKIGASVFDADKEVNRLYTNKNPELLTTVKKIDVNKKIIGKRGINKKKLGDVVFKDKRKLRMLEKTVFKNISNLRKSFLIRSKKQQKEIVVLDIPLLFENKINKICDFVIVTKALLKTRIKRVLKRPTMNQKKIIQIIEKQMPERKKQQLANFVIETDSGKKNTRKQISKIMEKILKTKKTNVKK